jgi:hypothetical protein
VRVAGHLPSGTRQRTAISKSTIFSANVDISLLKQNWYSPMLWAVKTKSPWRSLEPSKTTLPPGAVTAKSTSKEPPDWTYINFHVSK